jgi:hypothetical protein
MTEQKSNYTAEELGALIREAAELERTREILADPASLARIREEAERQVREEIATPIPPDPLPPEPRKRRRFFGRVTLTLAASVLLGVAGLTGYLVWRLTEPIVPPELPSEPHQFDPLTRPSGFAGATKPPLDDRSVNISAPAFPTNVFGSVGRGRLVALEFAAGGALRVLPHDDALCAWVLPGHEVSAGSHPFIRPNTGLKWVVLLVTDRPAAETLRKLVTTGSDFDRGNGPAASAATAATILKANGYRVFAYGSYQLKPISS